MNIELKRFGKPVLVVAALFVLLFSTSAQAVIDGVTGPSFSLRAKADQISTADMGSVLIWGYANGDGRAQLPGPTLIVNQGETVTVTLTNSLTVTAPDAPPNASIVFPGQTGVSAVGGVTGLFTQEAPPDGTTAVTYSFTASKPGTYMYHSGTNPQLQMEMGLFGAIVVRPTGFDGASNRTAYGHRDSAYDHEYLFLLSEMDPGIHKQVVLGLTSTIDNTAWWPVYWFINGRTAPDTMLPPETALLPTQPYDCMPMMHPGEKMLLRIVNAGRDLHPFHTHGNHVKIIARDGRFLSSAPGAGADLATKEFTVQSVPGETVDAIFTWTAKGLGWDIYGDINITCTDSDNNGFDDSTGDLCHDLTCTDTVNNETLALVPDGFDDATHEWCADHGKPIPVALPNKLDVTIGAFYSGSPFLGTMGVLPPDHSGFNMNAGLLYMWHSHREKEMVNFDIFPGGMMTMLIIEPPGTSIP